MGTAINNVHIYVNDLPVKYTPNSASYNDGRGTRNIRNQTVGGGAVEIIVTDDLETHIGGVKFSVRNDIDMIEKVELWRDNLDANVVVLVFEGSGRKWSKTFKQATISNNPDYELQTDGNVELEFETAVPK